MTPLKQHQLTGFKAQKGERALTVRSRPWVQPTSNLYKNIVKAPV